MTSDGEREDREMQDLLEERLGAGARIAPRTWSRVRERLAARADAEGLVDVAVARHDSPLGRLVLGATPRGLVRVGLPSEEEDAVLEELARRVSLRVMHADREPLTRAREQLDEYFAGRRRAFALPLDWRLARGFRREVLRATAAIPYGRTASYREVASRAGSPGAVRAAGTALATNPLPLVVPCHRVLRSDGALGQYRGGVEAKGRLLELERAA
jgi:methylated-DNA-[protein]-cysteine S-methyltransferase